MERRKGHYYDSNGLHSLLQTFSTIWTYGYEPQTGNIKAWVGGIDYKYFQYDHVGQSKTSLF
jgi:hypothetical protein